MHNTKRLNTRKLVLSLILLVSSLWVTGFYVRDIEVEKAVAQKRVTVASSVAPVDKDSLSQGENSDLVCKIVVMPKSYLPLLKQFSQMKIAKEIKMLPATLEYHDGKIVAVSQDKTSRKAEDPKPEAEYANEEVRKVGEEPAIVRAHTIQGLTMLVFLAEATQKRLFR